VLNNSSIILTILTLFICIGITLLLLYKFLEMIEIIGMDNCHYYSNKPLRNKGPIVMKCRRYKVVNGKLQTYYTEVDISTSGHNGYYPSCYDLTVEAMAPEGTTYLYLSCQHAWGFSEKKPEPKCLLFGSKKMIDIVESVEVENTIVYR